MRTVEGCLPAGGHRHRAGGVLTALAVMGLVVGLLPGLARAEYGPPGLSGAQIDLGNDGYPPSFQPIAGSTHVFGRSFPPNDVAQIFECPENAGNLHTECLAVGAAQTDDFGNFASADVPVLQSFSTANALASATEGPGVNYCLGSNPVQVQCSIVAATYDPTTLQPTAMAEHYICFVATEELNGCKPQPTGGGSTTTTTTTTTLNPPPGPEWEAVAPMNVARRALATAVGLDGRIYALGGAEADGDALNSAETYNPCKNAHARWSSIAPMPTARTQFAAATGPDGRIYVIGGRDRFRGTPLATVDAYDPTTNSWSSVARLALPRSELAAATGPDGRIYAIGGNAGGYAPSSTVEAYDTATNQWLPVAPLLKPRSDLGATTGLDGRMYAVGGRTTGLADSWEAAVESYSPGPAGTPGVWTPGTNVDEFPEVPPEMAVTTGPDGRIYGTGGVISANTVAIKIWRVYDTATESWTISTEAMTSRRTTHGAATGLDGRIYAIGGTDDPFTADDPVVTDGPTPLASAEALRIAPSSCPPGPPPPADFDGDGDTDVSVFRPSTGTWFVKDGATSTWGAQGDIPVPGDYDGDRQADVAIFRPATGLWAIRHSGGGPDTFVTYGIATDVPVPADYDGDGKTDIAVYRPDYATWWVHQSSDGADTARTFGLSTDVPVPGDYDGDGSADLGIFRDGTWFVLPASGGSYTATNYGLAGDIPVPGDYDGDHTTDMGIFRPSDGTWALHRSSDGADEIFGFGISGDVPVPGDYNADGVTDPAVFRSGQWFIETGETHSWGNGTDIALPLPPAVRLKYFA